MSRVIQREQFLQWIRELYDVGEVVTGSKPERKLVKLIRNLYGEIIGVDPKTLPVRVLSWEDRGSIIEACGEDIDVAAWPPTQSTEVENNIVEVREPLDPQNWLKARGKIALVELPEDPDDSVLAYLHATRVGVDGVVFYDRWSNRLRRIVVVDKPYLPPRVSIPDIPAVGLRREHAKKLLECRKIRLLHRGYLYESIGYTIELLVEKNSRREVLLTTHHDHWLGGVNDNLASVVVVAFIASRIAKKIKHGSLRVVSFTAEEFGDPSLSTWYWAYGSRVYVEALQSTGDIDELVAVLNLDIAASWTPKLYATGPEIRVLARNTLEKHGIRIVEEKYDTTESDSISFSRLGIPVVTVMDYESAIPIYHTDLDTVDNIDLDAIDAVARAYIDLATILLDRGEEALDYSYAINSIYEESRRVKGSIDLQAQLYKLLIEVGKALERKDYNSIKKVFRILYREIVEPVVIVTLDWKELELENHPFLHLRLVGEELNYIEELLDRKTSIDAMRDLAKIKLISTPKDEKQTIASILRHKIDPPTGKLQIDRDKLEIIYRAVREAYRRELRETTYKIQKIYEILLERRINP